MLCQNYLQKLTGLLNSKPILFTITISDVQLINDCAYANEALPMHYTTTNYKSIKLNRPFTITSNVFY